LRERELLSREDQELLQREFTISDPESVPNLASRLPTLSDPPQIIAKYDTKKSGRPALRCCHCSSRRHWKGYVLRLPNGQHALLAERHCGREAFGLRWEQVENAFKQQVSRQADLMRLARVRQVFPDFVLELECLRENEQVLAYDKFRDDLRRKFGPLSRRLGAEPRRNGRFDAEIRVRNREAEYTRARRLEPALVKAAEDVSVGPDERARNQRALEKWLGAQSPIISGELRHVGVCSGYAILDDENPNRLLSRAYNEAMSMAPAIAARTSDEWSGVSLAEVFRAMREIIECVRNALVLLGELARFCERKNFETLATWATQDENVPGKYRVDGGSLIDEQGNRLTVAITLAPLEAPAFGSLIQALQAS